MALTTHYVIFVGLLSYCSSSPQTEKFIWNSFHTCFLFFWFFLVTNLQSIILSSLCQWGDRLALHAAFKMCVHPVPVPRCHSIFFQPLFFLYCCWCFVYPSQLLIFELMFSENSEKNLSFWGSSFVNFVCITGLLQSGFFFPTYFASIDTEYLRDPFLCVCGQLLSGVTIWEHWRLMFIKQHSNLQRP